MIEKVILGAVVVLAAAYLAARSRRLLKGETCACADAGSCPYAERPGTDCPLQKADGDGITCDRTS